MSSPCNKYLASVFLIYLLPLILSTTPSYFIVFLPGSAFPLFHCNSSLHISHPAYLPKRSLHTLLLHSLLPAEFPKAPFSAQFFSICIPLLSALSSVLRLSLTSYMLMIHSSSYPLFLTISHLPSTTFSAQSLSPHFWCILTILLLIPLKLNSFSSVSLIKPLK